MSVWKVIAKIDESSKDGAREYIYVTKTNNSTNPPTRKIGVSGLNGGEDIKTKL